MVTALVSVAAAAATRATSDSAAAVLMRTDAALMDPTQMGPTPSLRPAYDLGRSLTSTVVAAGAGGAGQAFLAALVLPSLPQSATLYGVAPQDNRSDPEPERGERSTRLATWFRAHRLAVFFVPAWTFADGEPIAIRWRGRTLAAQPLATYPNGGFAAVTVQLDDGRRQEDESRESTPVISWDSLAQRDVRLDGAHLIVRGSVASAHRTRGFQRVRVHGNVVRTQVDVQGSFRPGDLGAPVVAPFEGGADPQVVGVIATTSDSDGWARVATVSDVTSWLRAVVLRVPGVVTDRAFVGIGVDDGDTEGVVVRSVAPGGPAALAGIELGSRIVAVDGTRVDDAWAFLTLVRRHAAGEIVRLDVVSGRVRRTVNVFSVRRPE